MKQEPDVFTPDEGEVHFPFVWFVVSVVVNLAAAIYLYWLWANKALTAEYVMPSYSVLGWTVVLGLPLSLFEYLYHRYLLHHPTLPYLERMCNSHKNHHGLTNVTTSVKKAEGGLVPVDNRYPIECKEQEASMHFPLYSMVIFHGVFGILLALPLKLIFPGQPILLATITAVTVYFVWYEVWHMVQHLPYSKYWEPLLARSAIIRRVYNFHLVHHFRQNMNMAVVGFYGFAIWDHVFRTCYRMAKLPVKGARVPLGDAISKLEPRWPISMVDSWKAPMQRWSRRVEERTRKLFGIKKTAL